jgi:hypothetical protein
VFRLVCAGQATPGQTGWQVLDGMSLDALTDFAYGLLVENRDEKDRKKVDDMLADAAARFDVSDVVAVRRESDGEVVHITEARLAQIERNMRGMGQFGRSRRREQDR